MSNAVVLSASSLNTYLECGQRWYYEHIARVPQQKSESILVGLEVHEHAEAMLRRTGGEDVPAATVSEQCQPLVDVFTQAVLPTYGSCILVEAPFSITLNGVPYSGWIDSIDGTTLRDLKTTGSRPRPGRYRRNLIGYYLGATVGLDRTIDSMVLDYIVRTKRPYYYPERQEVPTDDEVDVFVATAERAYEGIASGSFAPEGIDNGSCRWCPYRSMCSAYKTVYGGDNV